MTAAVLTQSPSFSAFPRSVASMNFMDSLPNVTRQHGHAAAGRHGRASPQSVSKSATANGHQRQQSSTSTMRSSLEAHVDNREGDDDRGEGSSTAASAMSGEISAKLGMKFLDIASLIKEPLIFVPARLPDDSARKIPYEPLPMRPTVAAGFQAALSNSHDASSSSLARPSSAPSNAIKGTSTSPSTPSLSSSAKGKGVLRDGHAHYGEPGADDLPMNWPRSFPVGPGYHNLGNTCFLNSTLQALTHTAPLVACLMSDIHKPHECKTRIVLPKARLCILCAMQGHVKACFKQGRAGGSIAPNPIVNNLSQIARNMRVGRQEDAHEFLRFFLDGMQEAAAANMQPPAKTAERREGALIYRIFGGKLRSRVKCMNCKTDSDTFDSFMDLSLDVSKAQSVEDALRAFVRTDYLKDANKYKCEKCKKLVNATKQFTIHQAPQILHVHLKRFTPTGRKIVGHIDFPEHLQLSNFMSSDAVDPDPAYRLYAVVCHSGSGPHSGHYFAHVRSGLQRWHCMNDSSVTESNIGNVLNQRNAYLLFYERSNRLPEAVSRLRIKPPPLEREPVLPLVNGLGKRKERDEEEAASSQPFAPRPIKMHTGAMNGQRKSMSSPFQQRPKSLSSPYIKSGVSPIAAGGFYNNKNQSHNRPRVIDQMIGRPRG